MFRMLLKHISNLKCSRLCSIQNVLLPHKTPYTSAIFNAPRLKLLGTQFWMKSYKNTNNPLSLNVKCCSNVPRYEYLFLRRFRSLFILAFAFPFFNKQEEEDPVISSMKMAILAAQRGDYSKAEQILHLALKSAQEKSDSKAITYIFDLMANFALQNGEFEKAEKLFVDVLKRFLSSGISDDDNAVVDVSLKLAGAYASLKDHPKAIEGFEFCIGTQEKKMKEIGEANVDEDTLVLWAMSHDWYARYLISLDQYDKAKSHFKRAYDVCLKIKGESDPQTAVLLNDLGSVASLQKNYDEAIEFLARAIEIGKKNEAEDLPSFYVNLGTVYLQKSVYEEAERYCREGKRLASKAGCEEALYESEACLDTLKTLRK